MSRAIPGPHRGGDAPAQRGFGAMLVFIAGLGICLRLLRYARGRSLWLDEIFLANNLIHKSFLELLGPLDYRQGAPPLFLWLCKCAIVLFGTSEYALRLVPLLAGICSVVIFALLVRRILCGTGALAALGLFALLEPLVYYSSEVKQYSTDVLAAVAILWAAGACARREDGPQAIRLTGRSPHCIMLLITGLVGIYLSHPAIFVLGGVGLALLISRKHKPTQLAPIFLCWALAVGLDYFFFLKPLEHNGGLQHYWAAAYPPMSMRIFSWLCHAAESIFTGYDTMWLRFTRFGSWPARAATVLALLGCINLYRRDALGLVLWPVILTLLAALLHAYPFDDRLILFLVPSVIIMMAAAVQGVLRPVTGCLLAYVLVSCAGRQFVFALHPPGREEIRPVMAYLKNHWRTGDTLYIYRPADSAFLYYRNSMGLHDLPYIQGQWQSGDADEDVRALAGRGRVWILFSHIFPTAHGDERGELLQWLNRDRAAQLEHFEAPGAGVYLYRMGPR